MLGGYAQIHRELTGKHALTSELCGSLFLKIHNKDLKRTIFPPARNKREFSSQYVCSLCCKIKEGQENKNCTIANNHREMS